MPAINFSYTTDQDRLKGKAQKMRDDVSRKRHKWKDGVRWRHRGSKSMLRDMSGAAIKSPTS